MNEPEHTCPQNNHPEYWAIKMHDGLWWMDDVFEGQEESAGILFCPFFGVKLEAPIAIEIETGE